MKSSSPPDRVPPRARTTSPVSPASAARRCAAHAFVFVLAGLAPACVTPVEHDGVPTEVLESHRHSAFCGHYIYGGDWFFVRNHEHGDDCGHVLRYGDWTLEP